MIKLKTDLAKNRLYITIIGTLTVNDACEAKKDIEKAIGLLNPKFDVINDISKFIRGDDSAGKILKEIIIMMIQKGVNKVVRVVGTSKTGLIQFANNSLLLDQYQINYVPTLEDAETLLNKSDS